MDPYKRGVVNLRDNRLIDTVTLTALRSLISLSMTYPWSPIKGIGCAIRFGGNGSLQARKRRAARAANQLPFGERKYL